ncbi:MAG: DUF721 domain-containing protein [Flavobacteriaceae bacterium]|nr:DUF721 domain-containing protein [Flavobacteriaceae bacterium]
MKYSKSSDYTRNNDVFSIQDLMARVLEKNNLSKGMLQLKVKDLWNDLMGSGVASYTQNVELRKNALFVRLSSSVLRQELSYGKEKIIKMLNKELENEVIKELHLL